MIGAYQETVFFHYILGNQIFLNTTKPEFFTNPNVRELFDLAKDHAIKYKEAPSKEQLSELVRVKGISDRISEDVVGAIYNSKAELAHYTPEWLEGKCRTLDSNEESGICNEKICCLFEDDSSYR